MSNIGERVLASRSSNSYVSPQDPYDVDRQQYKNWGNYSADSKANAIANGMNTFFWITADKLEELLKAGEEYNDSLTRSS
jgi:hypothetical protein